jgi:hypothetical protein
VVHGGLAFGAPVKLRWVRGASPTGADEWLAAWRADGQMRPHYHPVFAREFAPVGREPAAAIYRDVSGAQILYPFSVGALDQLPFCPEDLRGAVDIISPYGYGGPSFNGPEQDRERCEAEFRALFRDECERLRVVSEFVREDLHADHLVSDLGERILQQDNVSVRLGLSEDEHLRRYKHKVRKNIRRARECGLRVEIDSRATRLDEFLHVYLDTMRRTQASVYYHFRRDVFERLAAALEPEGALAFAHVLDGSEVVSTELLLTSRSVVYSFLGGTLEASMLKRPNDLLKHEVILWAGARGFDEYVLGGGTQPMDGIFQYKASFDPEGTRPFYVRRRVHDVAAYARLVEARNRTLGTAPRRDFFPAYRG